MKFVGVTVNQHVKISFFPTGAQQRWFMIRWSELLEIITASIPHFLLLWTLVVHFSSDSVVA